jgi:HEAT repeat protein
MLNETNLLTDEQMRQFITEGYLIFNLGLPEQKNKEIIEKLNEIYEKEGNPGNNLLPRLPELQQVFDHPRVKGALTSILGEDYMMHSHRHGHYNKSTQPQGWKWHKDDYFGYDRIRDHHPWWAMIFYYPQDVTDNIGPTGLVPGTQNYDTRLFPDHPDNEVRSIGKAGTAVLVHYDMWHRANPNISDKNRYMLKFQFVRTQQPKSPTWNNHTKEWIKPTSFTHPVYEHDVLWRNTWDWMTGNCSDLQTKAGAAPEAQELILLMDQLKSNDEALRVKASNQLGILGYQDKRVISALEAALEDSFEPVALNAAYGLSQLGNEGIASLLKALNGESIDVSKTAAYGLSIAGEQAVKGLIETLHKGDEMARAHAAYALGHLYKVAGQALPDLCDLMTSDSEIIRRNAAEALGYFVIKNTKVIEALGKGLQDSNVQVRYTSALSAARLGVHAEPIVDHLIQALNDENRYVRAYASEALYYIKSEKSVNALLNFLKTSRWCPITTAASTY